MFRALCVLSLFSLKVFAGSLAVPDLCYEYNSVTDLDSNKTFNGKYLYSASGKTGGSLFDRAEQTIWVNLEYNGKPLSPIFFSGLNVDEEYNYMGKKCAFLNGGQTTNNRIIICDYGAVMYLWTFYSHGTKRYMFTKK